MRAVPRGGRAKGAAPQWRHWVLAAEVACAQLLGLVALLGAEGSVRATGVALSLLATAAAAVRWLALDLRHADINLALGSLVSSVLCMLFLLSWLSQVATEARTDCQLAQLQLQDTRIRAMLEAQHSSRSAVFSSIKLRLEALDHTLSALQGAPGALVHGPAATTQAVQLQHQRSLWKASDAKFVAERLERVKEHALKVLQGLVREQVPGAGGRLHQLRGTVEGSLSEEDARELQARLDKLAAACRTAVLAVDAHKSGERRLAPGDYERLIAELEWGMHAMAAFVRDAEVLLGPGAAPLSHADVQKLLHGLEPHAIQPQGRPMQWAVQDTSLMKEALHRQTEDSYARLHIPDVAQARQVWQQQFEQLLASHVGEAGQNAASTELLSLAERCTMERRIEKWVHAAAGLLAAMQAVGMWVVWSRAVAYAKACWE